MSNSKLETNQIPKVITGKTAMKSGFKRVEYHHESNSFIINLTRWTQLDTPRFIVRNFWGHYHQEVYVTEDHGLNYHLMTEIEKLKLQESVSKNPPAQQQKFIRLNKPKASLPKVTSAVDERNEVEISSQNKNTALPEATSLPTFDLKGPVEPQMITAAIGAQNLGYLRTLADLLFENFKKNFPPNLKSLSYDKNKQATILKNTLQALRIYYYLNTGKDLPNIELHPFDAQIITDAIGVNDRKSLKIIAEILYEKLKNDYPSDQQSYSFFTMSEIPVQKNAMQALRAYFFLDTGIDLLNIDLQAGANEGILIEHNDKILKLLNDAYTKSEHIKNLASGMAEPNNAEEENLSKFFKSKDIFALLADVYKDASNHSLFANRLALGLSPSNLAGLKDRKIRQRLEASLKSYEITNAFQKMGKAHEMLQSCYIDHLKSLITRHHNDAGDLWRTEVVLVDTMFHQVSKTQTKTSEELSEHKIVPLKIHDVSEGDVRIRLFKGIPIEKPGSITDDIQEELGDIVYQPSTPEF